MADRLPLDGRVRLLPQATARKIAAGEVIDRPAAVVRELLDNAIDADATAVEISVDSGGGRRIEAVDDGKGLSREDLELCWRPHATSKIRHEDDLLIAGTLGFRGEALSAIAAVSRLELVSSVDGRKAWRLAVGPAGASAGEAAPGGGGDGLDGCVVEPAARGRGTTARVLGLFDNFPARKKFLKRDGAEAGLCKQALVEKALAFPDVAFRFFQDGELKLFLPAVQTRRERFGAAALPGAPPAGLHEIAASGPGFSLSIVIGGPETKRPDRRGQYVIVNGRRVQDFGLLQAIEYGVRGWFPNGSHPVGALYVDVDPALADFNIHPAKREVRFKDAPAIHAAATRALADFMRRLGIAAGADEAAPSVAELALEAYGAPADGAAPEYGAAKGAVSIVDYDGGGARRTGAGSAVADAPFAEGGQYRTGSAGSDASRAALVELLQRRTAFAPPPRAEPASGAVSFVGRAFGLFLVAEKGEKLYLIDQHAAHERLLYDRLSSETPRRQALLVPLPFRTETPAEDEFLASRRAELAALGIEVVDEGDGAWRLDALPAGWPEADADTVRSLLDLGAAGAGLADAWRAGAACRLAVKDGDFLDDAAAAGLAEAALGLPVPRCPHGRPVYAEISRDALLKAVRRIEE
jgi:DNA mismatch repair protein MutL